MQTNIVSIDSLSYNRTFRTQNFYVEITRERRRHKGEMRMVFEARIHLKASHSTDKKTFYNRKYLCNGISLHNPKQALREASKSYRRLHTIITNARVRGV